jgi:mercuric ion transport protein
MGNVVRSMIELACVPDAIPATDRAGHFALARELLTSRAREQRDLANGYAFRFDADALTLLVRFIENERKCCPFITFELVVSDLCGPLWLRMTGPEGTRDVLKSELDLSGSCGCDEGAQGSACGVSKGAEAERRMLTLTLAGGIFAAFGVCAACCLLPAALIGIGITGAWVGSIDSLSPYKWVFISLAAAMLGFVYYRLYVEPGQGLKAGEMLEVTPKDRMLRRMFWAGTAFAVVGVAYGFLEPFLTQS